MHPKKMFVVDWRLLHHDIISAAIVLRWFRFKYFVSVSQIANILYTYK